VVSSEDCDSVTVADFERHQQSDSLNRVIATIDVIAHEEVVSVWGLATNFEKFLQIVELAVNITANCYGCSHLRHIRLIDKDFFRLHDHQVS